MPDLGVELIVPGEDETARWQLGEMIRKLRELRGLTQKALADKIFISQPLLPKYENANRTIPRTTFTVILAALEV